MNKRLILETLLAVTLIAAFLGAFSGAFAVDKPYRVGVTAGPHAQIVEFTDFIQLNVALARRQCEASVDQRSA
jgi:ABC-type metal ion transport system substrate-binding protein